MEMRYPLSIRNDRILSPEYTGPAYVWDVDKTYLSTHFSSWQGLLKIPLEFAIDKVAIPGMAEVLRGLRRGIGETVACHPIYFISASPPLLRGAIEGKMLRDGVEYDGMTFKNWLRSVLELRPDRIFDQLGFKMAALLRGRLDRLGATEYLFGDDYERDAEAFSLYSRWINGDADLSDVEGALMQGGVSSRDRRLILQAARDLPERHGRVQRVYLHLEKNTPPEVFQHLAPLVVPLKGAYQLALALQEEGLVDELTVEAVKQAVVSVPKYRFGNVAELESDAKKRGLIRIQRKKTTRPVSAKSRSGSKDRKKTTQLTATKIRR